jgi:eukaryotic-like serine/threonine-protein kinase
LLPTLSQGHDVKGLARSRFQIVGQLGRGSMTEVYLCRLQGVAGFEKEVVVERILPALVSDPLCVRMFLDGARVAGKLNHANIVQVFEIGDEGGVPYVAMEYVRGVSLAQIITRAHQDGKIHYGHFAKLIAGVCEALDYAYNALDPSGEPFRLVHRDVSPPNVVVSREGIPKLLDFGLAGAKGRLPHNQAGMLKGGLRYMAPEQISPGRIDHRADIFSLGVCLYELTTGRNPFGPPGQSDAEILSNVTSATFLPPSRVAYGYPPELEEIVLAALERDLNRRPLARELRDRLEAFAAGSDHTSKSRTLVAWLHEVFPDFAGLSKTGEVGVVGEDIPRRSSWMGSTPEPTSPTVASGRPTPIKAVQAAPPVSVRPALHMSMSPSAPPRPAAGQSTEAWTWAALAVMALAAVVAVWAFKPRSAPRPTRVAAPTQEVAALDAEARTYLDAAEQFVTEKRFDAAFEMVNKAGQLQIKDPALNIRLTRLRYAVGSQLWLSRASTSLERGEWAAAIEAAKSVLQVDPNNAAATEILAQAQAGIEAPAAARPAAPPEETGEERPVRRPPQHRTTAAEPTAGRRPEIAAPIEEPARRPTPAVAMRTAAESAAPVDPFSDAPPARPAAPPPPKPAASLPAAKPAAPLPAPKPAASSPAPRPTPPPPVAAAPPPAPATPPAATSGPVMSSMPKSQIPPPSLPRVYVSQDGEGMARVCHAVESAVMTLAGVSPEFARGITVPMRRQVRTNAPIYPIAMYYFIVREAALRKDSATAAGDLAAAQSSGTIVHLKDLPGVDKGL